MQRLLARLAKVQLCIVHMARHSLNSVFWKTRKEIAAALKSIYACATVEQASQDLDAFESVWGKDYPSIVQS
jgi:putative transposase